MGIYVMRILYGIQGTGNGHITRARHMAKSFAKQQDIHVDYLFSGRASNTYFDMEAFSQYQTKQGLTFYSESGRVRRTKTLVKNNVFQFVKDVSRFRIKDYDLLVNDFEPVSAWAAKKAGIPSLSISHQAAFLHHIPSQDKGFFDSALTKYFAPTEYNLGTHWYHFGYNIIPPVVAEDLVNKAKETATRLDSYSRILVYLPFEALRDIREQLHVLSDYQFDCYHPNIQSIRRDANINWQPLSANQFKADLIKSAGVISNCGFELSTECLSLGKPMLVKPLRKQYEQLSNAYTLQKLGLCKVLVELSAEEIDDWLQSKQGVQINFLSNCDSLVDWIKDGNWQDANNICRSLWEQVSFPNAVKDKLNSLLEKKH